MNKSKIEWTDYTWNPVTGCLHNCDFCYAKKIDKRFGDGRFTPTFHPDRLSEPLTVKKPSRIFVGSMADLFGEWHWEVKYGVVGEAYSRQFVVDQILDVVKQCPQHTFIFLTKNPKGMQGFDFPANCWCGTSIENQEKADERIPELLKVKSKTLFVSYEPALGEVDFTPWLGLVSGCQIHCPDTKDSCRLHAYECKECHDNRQGLNWLIIGAQTGPGAIKPQYGWINFAVDRAQASNVPVFIKDNAADYYYGEVLPRQFPGVTA